MEIISGDTIQGVDKRPNLRVQKCINLSLALKFIESKGVKLVGIGAEEICDGNLKMILGMIWTIILRFQIQDISEEELSAKEALLLWVQKKTKGYPGVDVQNFHFSFQDGLAFCALIHKHRPDLLDYYALDRSDKKGNLTKAFEVAEKYLDVPAILDPADICDVAKPDERSIMTYVAALYHVFSKSNKGEAAAKQVSSLLDFEQSMTTLKDEYARRAQALKDWSLASTAQLADRQFPNSVEGVQAKISEFKSWKLDQKAQQGKEKTAVDQLFNQIQTKLRINKRPPYVPPQGLEPEALQQVWDELNKAEVEYGNALREELRRQRQLQAMVDSFNLRSAALEAWRQDKEKLVSSTELSDSIEAINASLRNLEAFEEDYQQQRKKVEALSALKDKIVAGNHRDAEQVAATQAQLQSAFDALGPQHDSRKAALQAQLEKLQRIQSDLVEYAKRALALMRALESAQETVNEPILASNIEDLARFEADYEKAASDVAAQASEQEAVAKLASELRGLGVQETTYSEYSAEAVAQRFAQTQAALEKRKTELANERTRQEANEQLCQRWAQSAEAFVAAVNQRSEQLKAQAEAQGELEETVKTVKQLAQEAQSLQGDFDALVALNQEIEDAEITENKHTQVTIETVKLAWDSLNSLAANTIKVLENELLVKQHSGVTPEELAEFKETFKHFDKDSSGALNRLELKSCLTSLGEDLTDAELDKVLTDFGITIEENGQPIKVLPFESFVAYLVKKHSDADNTEAVKEAFKVMAGDKEYITRSELAAHLPADKVEYLCQHMPPYPGVEGGLDYAAYAAKVYAN